MIELVDVDDGHWAVESRTVSTDRLRAIEELAGSAKRARHDEGTRRNTFGAVGAL